MPGPKFHPFVYLFKDDGIFPNSDVPLLLYRHPFGINDDGLADAMESQFALNGWTNSWRNGVYDYAHYHSTSHEALAVFQGSATLELGGPHSGSEVAVSAGDVIVIPAGVAHRQLKASDDFGVIGAYPDGRNWDVLRGLAGERPAADRRIAELPIPDTDPLFGFSGPLVTLWRGSEPG